MRVRYFCVFVALIGVRGGPVGWPSVTEKSFPGEPVDNFAQNSCNSDEYICIQNTCE
jgi:hypothetical protein